MATVGAGRSIPGLGKISAAPPGKTRGRGKENLNMWSYEKKLQYPVNIKNPNPALAKLIITQFGGPDGELGASLRYLSQRYTMPNKNVIGALTDIGIEVCFCSSNIGHYSTGQYITIEDSTTTLQNNPLHYKSIKYNTGSLRLQAVACDC